MTGDRLVTVGVSIVWVGFFVSLLGVLLPTALYLWLVLGICSLGLVILLAGLVEKRRKGRLRGEDRHRGGSLPWSSEG